MKGLNKDLTKVFAWGTPKDKVVAREMSLKSDVLSKVDKKGGDDLGNGKTVPTVNDQNGQTVSVSYSIRYALLESRESRRCCGLVTSSSAPIPSFKITQGGTGTTVTRSTLDKVPGQLTSFLFQGWCK